MRQKTLKRQDVILKVEKVALILILPLFLIIVWDSLFIKPTTSDYSMELKEMQAWYWAEVQERIKEPSFLSDAEEAYFAEKGYVNLDSNKGVWRNNLNIPYQEMYYPIVFWEEEVECVMYTTKTGNLVQIWPGTHGGYANKGEAHPNPLECYFGGDGDNNPWKMWRTDLLLEANEEYAVTYNQADREICVWSQGEMYQRFEVPKGFSWEVVYNHNMLIDQELKDTAWVFCNAEGEIWTFRKLNSLNAYKNYSGGEYLE